MNVSMAPAQRLFVIDSGSGVTCFGFDNCFEHSAQLASLLQRPDLAPHRAQLGTLEQYSQYRLLTKLAGTKDLGTYFDPGTPSQVKQILEDYRRSRARLRICLGDAQTGADWLDEHHVVGHIGRSDGSLKVPLMLASRRADGGPAILTACIVRMLDAKSRRELYRHPGYEIPVLSIERHMDPKYPVAVFHAGKLQAAFKSEARASAYIAFLRGERMRVF